MNRRPSIAPCMSMTAMHVIFRYRLVTDKLLVSLGAILYTTLQFKNTPKTCRRKFIFFSGLDDDRF